MRGSYGFCMRDWRFIRRMGCLGGPVKDVDESVSRSEEVIRWRCRCGWETKSHHFKLSQALAYGVVQKGWLRRLHFMRSFAPCFGKLVAGAQVYLLTRAAVPKSLLSRAPARTENMLFHAAQNAG
jgi:hypothetical protein